MKKKQLIALVDEKFRIFNDWILDHKDEKFNYTSRPNKWTTGQHVDHLIRSTGPVNQAFKFPKFVLKWKFGVCNRQERSYDETYNRYIDALENNNQKAFGRFLPTEISNAQKAQKVNELKCQGQILVKQIAKLNEDQLSKYIIPHPAIGYLTLREMGYFTAFHTEHHLNILKEFH